MKPVSNGGTQSKRPGITVAPTAASLQLTTNRLPSTTFAPNLRAEKIEPLIASQHALNATKTNLARTGLLGTECRNSTQSKESGEFVSGCHEIGLISVNLTKKTAKLSTITLILLSWNGLAKNNIFNSYKFGLNNRHGKVEFFARYVFKRSDLAAGGFLCNK